jgi:3-hydroxyacyl-CoA dehydrogenase/enoyl-CoA hydratase/3-hydroxybutyryl-CoA epimerase
MQSTTFRTEIDDDGILLLTFDVPGRSMNTITAQVVADLTGLIAWIKGDAAIKGVVITSGKPSGFCAGADLGEMGGNAAAGAGETTAEGRTKAAFDRSFALNRLLRDLETCGKPVAAAINGLALGGGLEIALACHYRVAANDNPKLQLGLPECKVGLIPGAGGTQRLPRLMGVMAAAPYLLEGKSMSAAEAQSGGVIHATAPTADLVGTAKAWVKANPKAKAPWDDKGFRIPGGGPHDKAAQAFMMGNAMLAKNSYGNYPAQRHILSSVYEGLQVPIDAALRIESRYFVKTLTRPEAQAMVRTLFLSMQALGKGESRPAGFPPTTFTKAGVLGAGLMGAGIAYEQAMAGIPTVLLDREMAAAEKGKDYSKKLLDKAVSRGKMTAEKAADVLARITPTTNYADLAGCDILVEAVFENPEIKADVTRQAEAHLPAHVVFGSNTSTLPITGLAQASQRPAQFIGIHFFSPVERMGLVEIIMGEQTDQATLAKTIDYVLKIRKTPIVVNDHRGFYTSRCFGTYTQEGLEMLGEGIAPAIIENVGRMSGMPMGPLEVSDSVGLDTALKVGRQMAQANGLNYNEHVTGQLVAWIVEDKGRVGRKAGKGFYDYGDDGKPTRLWPELTGKVEVTTAECPPALKRELTQRFLVRQAVEVARCFEQGVITDARDADVGSILAWGFAPYTGGCVSYMDLFFGGTLAGFVKEADRLADAYGERFRPPQLLRDMAAKGETFYGRFGPGVAKVA